MFLSLSFSLPSLLCKNKKERGGEEREERRRGGQGRGGQRKGGKGKEGKGREGDGTGKERGREGEGEKHRCVGPLSYALIGCFLYAPCLRIEPTTLVYWDNTLTN